MKTLALLAVLLAAAWAALSGHYSAQPLILAFGVLSLALVLWLVWRMDRAAGEPTLPPGTLRLLLRMPRYLGFVALEVVKSNVHLVRVVLDPRRRPRPLLIRARAGQRSLLAQVIHANSITLTPGTLTLDLRGGELLVHAFDEHSAASVRDGMIDRAACRLEGD